MILVSDSRTDLGMVTREGVRMEDVNSAMPGMGVGMDCKSLSRASSDGTLPSLFRVVYMDGEREWNS